jgi:hypothetical protein
MTNFVLTEVINVFSTDLVCFSSHLINAYYCYSPCLQMSPSFICFVKTELQLYSFAQKKFPQRNHSLLKLSDIHRFTYLFIVDNLYKENIHGDLNCIEVVLIRMISTLLITGKWIYT